MKYLLIGIINIIYGVLLLLTLSNDTPGFFIVLTIGLVLTLLGLSGCVLWIVSIVKNNKSDTKNEEALKSWFSLAKSFDIVLVIGLLFRALIIQPFIVDGVSMENSFHDKEALLVDKISYRFNEPNRGDVVVFQAPKSPQYDYIKRVIGLPGETVTITSGKVYINDKLLNETYLKPGTKTYIGSGTTLHVTLGTNDYFVMGDNRENSSDSREWGPVALKKIIGRAWIIVYPLSDKGIVTNPNPTLESNNTLN
jgi:signal peptidase I